MRKFKLLAAVAASAVAFASAPAMAEGVASGTTINNTATLNYQTGGVAQAAVNSNNAAFLVDRKINLVVTELNGAATVSVGGALNQVTRFNVQNLSNAPLDFALSSIQAGVTAPFGGTSNFAVTGVRFFIDSPTGTTGSVAGQYDATDIEVTYLDEIPADAIRFVYILANVPAGRVNGDIAAIQLNAVAHEAGTAGTLGVTVTATPLTQADNPLAVDTVFADVAGATGSVGDAARDGRASARSQYNVVAASITLTKTARTIADPFNGTNNPKAIPGATIEYCIIARNTGSAPATNVNITDSIAAKPITYVAGSGINAGTVSGTPETCTGGTATGATFAADTFSAAIGTIPAGEARSARFHVTVNATGATQ